MACVHQPATNTGDLLLGIPAVLVCLCQDRHLMWQHQQSAKLLLTAQMTTP